MSLEVLQRDLILIEQIQTWNIYALKHKQRKSGREYTCCPICFTNPDDIAQHIRNTKDYFIESRLNSTTSIEDYSGFNEATAINKILINNPLISDNWNHLMQSVINCNDQTPILDFGANGYIVDGTSNIDPQTPKRIILISLRAPYKNFKKASVFSFSNNSFTKMDDTVLSLSLHLDLIIINNTVYLPTLNGESLFDLERTQQIKARAHIQTILESAIIHDFEIFGNTAISGHNPRRFLSFEPTKLIHLSSESNRQNIGRKFDIPLNVDGLFDITEKNHAENLIKFLCGKGMEDPVDHSPREVPMARPWAR